MRYHNYNEDLKNIFLMDESANIQPPKSMPSIENGEELFFIPKGTSISEVFAHSVDYIQKKITLKIIEYFIKNVLKYPGLEKVCLLIEDPISDKDLKKKNTGREEGNHLTKKEILTEEIITIVNKIKSNSFECVARELDIVSSFKLIQRAMVSEHIKFTQIINEYGFIRYTKESNKLELSFQFDELSLSELKIFLKDADSQVGVKELNLTIQNDENYNSKERENLREVIEQISNSKNIKSINIQANVNIDEFITLLVNTYESTGSVHIRLNDTVIDHNFVVDYNSNIELTAMRIIAPYQFRLAEGTHKKRDESIKQELLAKLAAIVLTIDKTEKDVHAKKEAIQKDNQHYNIGDKHNTIKTLKSTLESKVNELEDAIKKYNEQKQRIEHDIEIYDQSILDFKVSRKLHDEQAATNSIKLFKGIKENNVLLEKGLNLNVQSQFLSSHPELKALIELEYTTSSDFRGIKNKIINKESLSEKECEIVSNSFDNLSQLIIEYDGAISESYFKQILQKDYSKFENIIEVKNIFQTVIKGSSTQAINVQLKSPETQELDAQLKFLIKDACILGKEIDWEALNYTFKNYQLSSFIEFARNFSKIMQNKHQNEMSSKYIDDNLEGAPQWLNEFIQYAAQKGVSLNINDKLSSILTPLSEFYQIAADVLLQHKCSEEDKLIIQQNFDQFCFLFKKIVSNNPKKFTDKIDDFTSSLFETMEEITPENEKKFKDIVYTILRLHESKLIVEQRMEGETKESEGYKKDTEYFKEYAPVLEQYTEVLKAGNEYSLVKYKNFVDSYLGANEVKILEDIVVTS